MKENTRIPDKDTIVAIATPPGKGAIGIVRTTGPNTRAIAEAILGHPPRSRYAHFCNLTDRNDNVIDQTIVIFYPGPASYTGEDVLEVQGHGGAAVLGLLQDRILELGARPANPGEFTERAFLNDKIDLVQAEAVADLIDSVSAQAARCAIRSLSGDFSRQLDEMYQALVNIRVLIEGSMDFSDEDIDFLQDRNIEGMIGECIKSIRHIRQLSTQGARLRESKQVLILGPVNVGKSSLMNRLTGEDTAIVNFRAGTTRDVIKEEITIGRQMIQLVDTAGIRNSPDEIETEGIRRALDIAVSSDVVLLMFECVQSAEERDNLINLVSPGTKTILVQNKIDLKDLPPGKSEYRERVQISLSAKTGAGVLLLKQHLEELLTGEIQEENLILARQRHLDAISSVETYLEEAMNVKHNVEEIAENLRLAQNELGRVTGVFTPDDLLGEIFSRFCIGK